MKKIGLILISAFIFVLFFALVSAYAATMKVAGTKGAGDRIFVWYQKSLIYNPGYTDSTSWGFNYDFPEGTSSVQITDEDAAGNQSSWSQPVYVAPSVPEDTTPPVGPTTTTPQSNTPTNKQTKVATSNKQSSTSGGSSQSGGSGSSTVTVVQDQKGSQGSQEIGKEKQSMTTKVIYNVNNYLFGKRESAIATVIIIIGIFLLLGWIFWKRRYLIKIKDLADKILVKIRFPKKFIKNGFNLIYIVPCVEDGRYIVEGNVETGVFNIGDEEGEAEDTRCYTGYFNHFNAKDRKKSFGLKKKAKEIMRTKRYRIKISDFVPDIDHRIRIGLVEFMIRADFTDRKEEKEASASEIEEEEPDIDDKDREIV